VIVDNQNIALSAGYDSNLFIWDLSTHKCVNGLLKGHTKPIT